MATAFIAGYDLSSKTTIERPSNILSRISDSGILRFVDLGAQTYFVINAVIEGMSEAEKETLMDWLETNETTVDIDLDAGTETYRGYINPENPIQDRSMSGAANLYEVRFGFLGIKQ